MPSVVMDSLLSERSRAAWDQARRALDGLPGGGLNIAHEAVHRHAAGPRGSQVALRFLPRAGGPPRELTYGALAEATNRFASVLHTLGLQREERVFVLAGRIPELYVAVLGSLSHANVVCPLFSAFGPEPVRQRLGRCTSARWPASATGSRCWSTSSWPARLPALRFLTARGT
jgi:acetyl-CoA synthetase